MWNHIMLLTGINDNVTLLEITASWSSVSEGVLSGPSLIKTWEFLGIIPGMSREMGSSIDAVLHLEGIFSFSVGVQQWPPPTLSDVSILTTWIIFFTEISESVVFSSYGSEVLKDLILFDSSDGVDFLVIIVSFTLSLDNVVFVGHSPSSIFSFLNS